jgi:hypothetical protein
MLYRRHAAEAIQIALNAVHARRPVVTRARPC